VRHASSGTGRAPYIEALLAVFFRDDSPGIPINNGPSNLAGAKFQERLLTTLASRFYSNHSILSRIPFLLCGHGRTQPWLSRILLCSSLPCTCHPACKPERPSRHSTRPRPFQSNRKPSPCRLCDACMPDSRRSSRSPSCRSRIALPYLWAPEFERVSSALTFGPMT